MSWLIVSKTNSTTLSVTCAVHSGRANRTVRQAGANATIEIENSSEYTFPNFAASGGTQTAKVSTNDTDWSPQANED